MRVAVAYEAGQPLVVEDLEPAPLGPRDVLVRIAASGICHTDLTVIAGRSPLPLPIVPGHEACGVVEEAGPEVRRVRRGDRVLAVVSPACGTCWSCVNGMSNHCERGPGIVGTKRFALPDGRMAGAVCGCGSFAEAMVVDEASVIAVETDLPDDQLALLGCGVTTGLGAALEHRRGDPRVQRGGDRLRWCGPVGGPGCPHRRRGHDRGRRPVGRTPPGGPGSGRHRTRSIPPRATRSSRCGRVTGGRGADFTFEVVGRPELMVQAYDMARVEGTVTLVGMPSVGETVTLPAMSAVFSGKRLAGSAVGGSQVLRDVPRFIRLAEAGRLDLGSLVSRHIKLDEINDGIEGLHRVEGTRTVIV